MMAIPERTNKDEIVNLRAPGREEYVAIISAYEDNDLELTIDLMSEVEAYAVRTPRFRQQLNQLLDEEIERSQRTISRQEIAEAMFDFIRSYEPLETRSSDPAHTTDLVSQAYVVVASDRKRLPVPGNFVGRSVIANQLLGMLEDDNDQGVCITGLPGNGKTSLCHYVLRQWLQKKTDRQIYRLGLEFMSTAGAFLQGLACLCKLGPYENNPEKIWQAIRLLPPGILYLDNLETPLIDSKTYNLLEQLSQVDGLKILASSRQAVAGFRRLGLDVLSEEDALHLFSSLWWQQRGERVLPEADDKKLRNFIMTHLSAHPLSIELVASHAETVTDLDQLIEEFKEAHAYYLTRFGSDEEGRLNNLERSFDLSLQKLERTPHALRFLLLCAVFTNGLGGPAQKQLIREGVFKPADRATLLMRSLLKISDGRLKLPPPLTRYLQSILLVPEETELRGQIFEVGLSLAQSKETPVVIRLQFLAFFAPFLEEFPQLINVYAGLSNLDFVRNAFLARTALETLAENHLFQLEENGPLLGKIKTELGQIANWQGENTTAKEWLQRAEEIFLQTNRPLDLAHVKSNQGVQSQDRGDLDLATTRFREALELYQQVGDKRGMAEMLQKKAVIEMQRQDLVAAKTTLDLAENLFIEVGSEQGHANVLAGRGHWHLKNKEPEEAISFFNRAKKMYKKVGEPRGEANILLNLGRIALDKKEVSKGLDLLTQAQKIYNRTGSQSGEATINRFLAKHYSRIGEWTEAQKNWKNAIDIYFKTDANGDLAHCLLEIAAIVKMTKGDADSLISDAEKIITDYHLTHLQPLLKEIKSYN